MIEMRFDFVTVYVKDMERSLAFYRDVIGLTVLRRHPAADGELAFLGESGNVTLELIASPRHAENTYNGFSLGFAVDSLSGATVMMEEKGFSLLRGPVSPAPGVRFGFFAGPDGEEIELIEYTS
ncbi:MAG: VOC family protein [Oscillospiraceae bacterium]|jgi:lactoylglutathione lyase|nr:VOC family protein [Oscillospiraceae bacterium]